MPRQVILFEMDEWDQLVKQHYPQKCYRIQQQEGCYEKGTSIEISVNDSILTHIDDFDGKFIQLSDSDNEMGVDFDTWKKTSYRNSSWKVEMFWERQFYPDVTMIAKELYQKGVLPAGDYIIEFDW